jgi:hypothetical protein
MKAIAIIMVVLFSLVQAEQSHRFELDVESGLARVFYSDVRIPGTTGTLVSFSDELKTDASVFVRGRLTYYFSSSNSISLLIAPLVLNGSGSVDRDVFFEGVTFAANTPLNTVYRFNSYRVSYQHFWSVHRNVDVGLGLTAKIRDAAISIADSAMISEKTNIGFVPIIRFSCAWRFADPFALVVEGDALAAPQGRAEDVSCTIQAHISNRIALKAGYRMLEGGSDVDEVYSFTWINYYLGGALFRF